VKHLFAATGLGLAWLLVGGPAAGVAAVLVLWPLARAAAVLRG
jgi:hypothetical protein